MNAAIVGGAERHTAALANDLAGLGFSPTIFALKVGSEGRTGNYSLIEPAAPTGFFARARELAALLAAGQFDLVVAVNQRPLALVAMASVRLKHRPPVAVIFHTTTLRNLKEEVMQIAYNRLFNRSDLVVFISDNQRRHWLRRGLRPRGQTTILNGIDHQAFAPASAVARLEMRRRLDIADDDFIVGCSAMLRTEKNHLQLIEAVALLRAEGIPAKCLLVGDGPMRPAMEASARALNISGHVLYVGKQKDVRPYIAAFDVGVLCSTSVETLSLSALEIMSMGVPMVMSDIGGASEIVDGSNGQIFQVGDIRAFVDALRSLTDPKHRLRMGAAARATVDQRFAMAQMNSSFAAQFRSLAKGAA